MFFKLISNFAPKERPSSSSPHYNIKKMKAGIYIHIPFCKSRCIYCGFYSTTCSGLKKRYVNALLAEMQLREKEFCELGTTGSPCEADTIYIGGGTPSALSCEDLEKIIDTTKSIFNGSPREITAEMNPDDITPELIRGVKAVGANRISMGVQTFNDERLQFIRRRHTAEQARYAVETVRKAGIDNISIDLMFGFPNETKEEWKNDINAAIALAPNHISAYSLMYEEGTPLFGMLQSGEISQIDEETSLEMYSTLIDTLTKNGYEHYEISNFARKGFRSLHNSSYWHDTPYLGFGASAHSYNRKTRSWNVADLKSYIEAIEKGTRPYDYETIDADTHYNDLITTAMRTCEGLDIEKLSATYRDFALNAAKRYIENGLLEIADGHLRLTRKGLFVSDTVMSDLVKV